jgi:hypothetical protein
MARNSFSRVYWYYPLILLPAVAMVGVVAYTAPSRDKEEELCAKAVDAVLHSTDLVEVTRAGIIIRETSCSIRMHLD